MIKVADIQKKAIEMVTEEGRKHCKLVGNRKKIERSLLRDKLNWEKRLSMVEREMAKEIGLGMLEQGLITVGYANEEKDGRNVMLITMSCSVFDSSEIAAMLEAEEKLKNAEGKAVNEQ